MTRWRPVDRTKRRENRVILGTSLLAIVIVSAFGVFWIKASRGRIHLDDELCPADDGPVSYTAVILDVTDPYTAVQKVAIRGRFEAIQAAIPEGGRLSIYALDEELPEALAPQVQLCNPGDGSGASIWTQNPELIKRRWERDFRAPLEDLLDRSLDTDGAARSPLVETIQAASLTAFPYEAGAGSKPKRMLIFSDLLQHTEEYSQYGAGPPTFSDFQKLDIAGHFQARLEGVDVVVYYVRRTGPGASVQGRSHIEFWERWVDSVGGALVEVETIEG